MILNDEFEINLTTISKEKICIKCCQSVSYFQNVEVYGKNVPLCQTCIELMYHTYLHPEKSGTAEEKNLLDEIARVKESFLETPDDQLEIISNVLMRFLKIELKKMQMKKYEK